MSRRHTLSVYGVHLTQILNGIKLVRSCRIKRVNQFTRHYRNIGFYDCRIRHTVSMNIRIAANCRARCYRVYHVNLSRVSGRNRLRLNSIVHAHLLRRYITISAVIGCDVLMYRVIRTMTHRSSFHYVVA